MLHVRFTWLVSAYRLDDNVLEGVILHDSIGTMQKQNVEANPGTIALSTLK